MSDTSVTGEGSPAKRWYSVSEAAEYLDVSQPTIFRWMKAGLLSFFKIGGGTRFTKEVLDAVIEKTTGLKEAEAAAGRCALCGQSGLINGQLEGTGRIYFHPSVTRFWTFEESAVPIKAKVCSACGHIQMLAEVSKLTRLMPKKNQTAEPTG